MKITKSTKTMAFVCALTAFSAFSAVSPVQVHAAEPIMDVAKQSLFKKQMVKNLVESLQRHQKMPLEEIKKDALARLENNREYLRSNGLLSTQAEHAMDQAKLGIAKLDQKDALIQAEKAELQKAVSAGNYLFMITRGFYNSPNMSEDAKDLITFGTLFAFPAFLIALDFAILPATLVASIVTGW